MNFTIPKFMNINLNNVAENVRPYHHPPQNHQQNVSSNTIGIGKIYSDGCGYCIALKPIWGKMKELIGKQSNVEYIELEANSPDYASRKAEIERKYGLKQPISVSGYPTIFRIKNGEVKYFDKERIPETMKEFFLENKAKTTKTTKPFTRRVRPRKLGKAVYKKGKKMTRRKGAYRRRTITKYYK
jgi:thiol-disulfide isomerase/thioredoxin